jgi:hypothetical protein
MALPSLNDDASPSPGLSPDDCFSHGKPVSKLHVFFAEILLELNE